MASKIQNFNLDPETEKVFRLMQAQIENLRTQYTALLVKMDADFANVTNASVDYAATVGLSAATLDD